VVFYNRSNEAAALLKPGDFDWDRIFASGVRWFHSGGIFASLSETTSELIIEGMQAAHKHGAVVSLDLNYREKLWAAAGGAGRAVATLARIVEQVDVLVGNEEDLQKGLGIAGPEMTSKAASALDHSTFSGMIEGVVKRFPRIKVVATTLRQSTGGSTSRRPPSSTSTTGSAAATALRPACSTVCSPASRPRSA
jgi:2-dehydro-3-deoxygluconokinase